MIPPRCSHSFAKWFKGEDESESALPNWSGNGLARTHGGQADISVDLSGLPKIIALA